MSDDNGRAVLVLRIDPARSPIKSVPTPGRLSLDGAHAIGFPTLGKVTCVETETTGAFVVDVELADGIEIPTGTPHFRLDAYGGIHQIHRVPQRPPAAAPVDMVRAAGFLGGVVVEVDYRTEPIATPMLLDVPDPDWYFVDAAGHKHYHRSILPGTPFAAATGGGQYPTLYEAKVGEFGPAARVDDLDEDDEPEYEPTEYRCRRCGEVIRPGTKAGAYESIPGPLSVTFKLDTGADIELDYDQSQAFVAEMRQAQEDEADRHLDEPTALPNRNPTITVANRLATVWGMIPPPNIAAVSHRPPGAPWYRFSVDVTIDEGSPLNASTVGERLKFLVLTADYIGYLDNPSFTRLEATP